MAVFEIREQRLQLVLDGRVVEAAQCLDDAMGPAIDRRVDGPGFGRKREMSHDDARGVAVNPLRQQADGNHVTSAPS
ncbi:hypothetical protein [Pikeienuella piscinae]|uniref:hypothetical protein n=1 Tax=Pikeienuella piscinae TaxID=2748098 RepID=UPI001BA7E2F7|nr:hypothetical protein [Pikeienuella piscinae]